MDCKGAVELIDMSQCPTVESLASAIRHAMQTSGFLFIRNHGLEAQAEEMFKLSETFFHDETDEEKLRCAYQDNRGYTRVSQEVLDPSKPAPDLKEGFNIGYIALGPPPTPSHPLPRVWTEQVDKLARFQVDCFQFCQRLMEAFALILELPQSFFANEHAHDGEDVSILRFLHYPEIAADSNVSPNRAGAHSDYGSVTLLFQRQNGGEGLEILPSAEPLDSKNWIPTGVVQDAMLVNIGDALELWSGAFFKSTLHRVVLPTPIPAQGIPERFSIAWFNQPKSSASLRTVVAASQITEHDYERMTRKGVKPGTDITASEHLQARLASTYKPVSGSS